jgi:hypothetical protein
MYLVTPKNGFHFNEPQIAKISELYHATYMGYWCTKTPSGQWNDRPVDVFYVEQPDRTKGHTNYFGIYKIHEWLTDAPYICEASSAFSEPITGVLCEDGEVIVSRYRHDCVTKGPYMIDGGRDYVRSHGAASYVTVTVQGGEFVLTNHTEQNEGVQ